MSDRVVIDSGWIQVNNTVVPYVKRHLANGLPVQLVPLPVIRYGAELLCGVYVQTLKATPGERKVLNNRCARAGLNFVFDDDIDLIPVYDIVRKYRKDVYVSFLPEDDPLSSAQFHVELCSKANHCKGEKCTWPGSRTLEQSTTDSSTPVTSTDNKDDVVCVLDLSRKPPSVRQTVNQRLDDAFARNQITSGSKENPIDLTQKSSSGNEVTYSLKSSIILASSTSAVRQPPDAVQGSVRIVPVRLRNQVVPSIVKACIHYVLVETIRKAYFPDCSLTAFLFIARRYIGRYMYNLTQEDIDAILKFVKNPSCLKRCTKVVTIRDADQMIPVVKRFLARVRSRVKHKHEVRSTDAIENKTKPTAPFSIQS